VSYEFEVSDGELRVILGWMHSMIWQTPVASQELVSHRDFSDFKNYIHPEDWEVIMQAAIQAEWKLQVEGHKYFINQSLPYEISMAEALESWKRLVHGPVCVAIYEMGLEKEFPGKSEDSLVLSVIHHWHQLKEGKGGTVSALEAVLSYGSLFAPTDDSRFDFQLRKSFFYSWHPRHQKDLAESARQG